MSDSIVFTSNFRSAIRLGAVTCLVITDRHLAAVERHCAQSYPEEACGILVGTFLAGELEGALVETILPVRNDRPDRRERRYSIDPKALLAAQKQARSQGLDVVGYYHSHPDSPARPSELDREHAWPGVSYLIVSVDRAGVTGARSWRLRDDHAAFDEEQLLEPAAAAALRRREAAS